jgi:hypothetical protein
MGTIHAVEKLCHRGNTDGENWGHTPRCFVRRLAKVCSETVYGMKRLRRHA